MKSPELTLILAVCSDAERWCDTNLFHDKRVIASRFDKEGKSFLTQTLPSFEKAFLRSLADGRVCRTTFAGFSYPRKGALPRFLSGLLRQIFDDDGVILDKPNTTAIYYVRQVCLLFKKEKELCSERKIREAFQTYLNTDLEIRTHGENLEPELVRTFRTVAARLFGGRSAALQLKEEEWLTNPPRPKHGPGATADKRVGNAKYVPTRWHERLECFFPADLFLIPNAGFFEDMQDISIIAPDQEDPVRVIAVPKTQTKPRIIACEPCIMQYAQQSVMRPLVDWLESPVFKGALGFLDQVPNQELARLASVDGSLATLDLSEASDRVLNTLVLELFDWCPWLRDAIQACRSTHTRVEGLTDRFELAKFASMGSALCFPVEAMYFSVIVLIGFARARGWSASRLTHSQIDTYLEQVRIYGDDIIVPTDVVSCVRESLTAFGLVVNQSKTFETGKFRESCGGDYYDGQSVTPVYVRYRLPQRREDHEGIIGAVSLRNQLFKAGCWTAVRYLDGLIEDDLRLPFPVVEEHSAVLGRHSCLGWKAERVCPRLHRPLVKGLRVRAPTPKKEVGGVWMLMKWFLTSGPNPSEDPDHLLASGRPRCVSTRVAWSVPY